MWLALLSLLVLADEPVDDVTPEQVVAVEAAPPVLSIPELVDQARGRIHEADYEGAALTLATASTQAASPEEIVEVRYFQGVVLELQGQLDQALDTYEATSETFPAVRTQDLRFRRAEVLASMARYADALDALDALGPLASPADQSKVNLVRAIWTLQSGQVVEGRDAITVALADTAPQDVTFYQAKAHAVWAESLVAEARDYPLDVKQRQQVKALEARAALMKEAEQHVIATANLKEIEWILAGLHALGQGYTDVGDALLNARPPRKIARRDDRLAAFQAALLERSEVVWTKAHGYYTRAQDVALANQWHGPRVDAIAPAIAEVEARFP